MEDKERRATQPLHIPCHPSNADEAYLPSSIEYIQYIYQYMHFKPFSSYTGLLLALPPSNKLWTHCCWITPEGSPW